MAQIVVRTRAKELSGDLALDRHRLGRGDVIDILPDTHQFSQLEKDNPDWRIIRIPGVPAHKLTALVESEDDGARRLLRLRRFRLNIAALLDLLSDPVRRQEFMSDPTKAEAATLGLIEAAAD